MDNLVEINNAIEALSLFNSENPSPKIEAKISELEKTLSKITATTNKVNEVEDVIVSGSPKVDLSYIPVSQTCKGLDTLVPASQRYEMLRAMETIDRKVGGVDEYVADRLGYINSKCEIEEYKTGMQCLCNAFSAEQVDAIAMAIYNIEERKQGCIIGDMTGIGKGRIAGGIIKYAINQGRLPIFFTEKPNLFSDIYRDLISINADAGIPKIIVDKNSVVIKRKRAKVEDIKEKILSDIEDNEFELDGFDSEKTKSDKDLMKKAIQEYRELYFEDKVEEVYDTYKNKNYDTEIIGKERIIPFIINKKEPKTNILDEDNNTIYTGQDDTERNSAFELKRIPKEYNVVLTTYSQFGRTSSKYSFLQAISEGAIIIMDESHNASGDSNVGIFLRGILELSEGCLFLSATFAKRPDNMPLYASKTCIKDCQLEDKDLVFAIEKGGSPLQEILSSQLTSEGQMLRRERSYDGIQVKYEYLDERQVQEGRPDLNLRAKHSALSDSITDMLRKVILFQREFVDPFVKVLKTRAKKNKNGGVDNQPAFSGIFQVINQLLFSIKAETSAMLAVEAIRNGEKPIIAFSSTMESFLNYIENEDGTPVGTGDIIQDDFSLIVERRLKNCLKYKVTTPEGESETVYIDLEDDLGSIAKARYDEIYEQLKSSVTGVSLFPIDIIKNYIWNAGFKVNEVTGRSRNLKINGDGTATIQNRQQKPVKQAFNEYNNNEVDCLLINITGATGASAHAIPTKSVPADKVKPRHMIILQAELDINKEVQKRGRIFRTGQIYNPKYTYVISCIPAEKRFMMMLQKKLASLDSNTSANQKNSNALLSVTDFLNKYGDKITIKFLSQNVDLVVSLDDPLGMLEWNGEVPSIKKEYLEEKSSIPDGAVHKVTGRIAILKTEEQEAFYESIIADYIKEIQYLDSVGENDLEIQYIKYNAETISRNIAIAGNGSDSPFGGEAYVEHCLVDNLKKPNGKNIVDALINDSLTIKDVKYTGEELQKILLKELEDWKDSEDLSDEINANLWKEKAVDGLKKSPQYKKLLDKDTDEAEEWHNNKMYEIDEITDRKLMSWKSNTQSTYNLAYNRFKFFYIGRVISIKEGDKETEYGVFTGYKFGNSKNKFTPSNVSLNFQFPSNRKNLNIPMSKMELIFAIQNSSQSVDSRMQSYWYEDWNSHCKSFTADKIYANIVTGNILLAYKVEQYSKGKLIEYTLADGGRAKGILLNEQTEKSTLIKGENMVNIPLSRLKLPTPTGLVLKGEMFSLTKERNERFSLRIGGKKDDYFAIIQSADLKSLSINNTFTKVGETYNAIYEDSKWNSVIEVLIIMNVSANLTLARAIELGFEASKKEGVREPLIDHIKEVVEGEYANEKPPIELDKISHLISESQYSYLKDSEENQRLISMMVRHIPMIPKLYEGKKEYVLLKYFNQDNVYYICELAGQNAFGYKNGEYGKLNISEIIKDCALDMKFISATDYGRLVNTTNEVEEVEQVQVEPKEGGLLSLAEFKHTKKGYMQYVVKMNSRTDEFVKLKAIATKNGGFYSSFSGGGAIAGFLFMKKEQALKMINDYNNG